MLSSEWSHPFRHHWWGSTGTSYIVLFVQKIIWAMQICEPVCRFQGCGVYTSVAPTMFCPHKHGWRRIPPRKHRQIIPLISANIWLLCAMWTGLQKREEEQSRGFITWRCVQRLPGINMQEERKKKGRGRSRKHNFFGGENNLRNHISKQYKLLVENGNWQINDPNTHCTGAGQFVLKVWDKGGQV